MEELYVVYMAPEVEQRVRKLKKEAADKEFQYTRFQGFHYCEESK